VYTRAITLLYRNIKSSLKFGDFYKDFTFFSLKT